MYEVFSTFDHGGSACIVVKVIYGSGHPQAEESQSEIIPLRLQIR